MDNQVILAAHEALKTEQAEEMYWREYTDTPWWRVRRKEAAYRVYLMMCAQADESERRFRRLLEEDKMSDTMPDELWPPTLEWQQDNDGVFRVVVTRASRSGGCEVLLDAPLDAALISAIRGQRTPTKQEQNR